MYKPHNITPSLSIHFARASAVTKDVFGSQVPGGPQRYVPFAYDIDGNLLVVATATSTSTGGCESLSEEGASEERGGGVFEYDPDSGLGDRLAKTFREFAEAYYAQLTGAPSIVDDKTSGTATAHAMEFVEGVGVVEVLCTLPTGEAR